MTLMCKYCGCGGHATNTCHHIFSRERYVYQIVCRIFQSYGIIWHNGYRWNVGSRFSYISHVLSKLNDEALNSLARYVSLAFPGIYQRIMDQMSTKLENMLIFLGSSSFKRKLQTNILRFLANSPICSEEIYKGVSINTVNGDIRCSLWQESKVIKRSIWKQLDTSLNINIIGIQYGFMGLKKVFKHNVVFMIDKVIEYKETECPVCNDEFTTISIVTYKCGHQVCRSCIDKMQRDLNEFTCCLCQEKIKTVKIVKEY